VYALLGNETTISQLQNDINALGTGLLSFNRLNLAFVRPTLVYRSGSLAHTGLAGYYGVGDGHGTAAFRRLRKVVKSL
jgi:hypothetical protein